MNLNNTSDQINLFICLIIILFQESFIKLPHNITKIIMQPFILLTLLLLLTFVLNNNTTMILLVILYFVIVQKSSDNDTINSKMDYYDLESGDTLESDDNLESDDTLESDINKLETNNKLEVNNKLEINNETNNEEKSKETFNLLDTGNKQQEIYQSIEGISQNQNIISNVSKTQLDKIQGEEVNYCK